MKLSVAVCQVDMEWERTAKNLARLEPIVASAEADIVVLPEMFATGFKLQPARVAEPADGPVVSAMRRWAAAYGRAIVGSAVIAEDGRYRNRMFFVKPSGETAWYDKHHLFRPGGEGRDYTPGDRRVVVEYKGVRFLLQICYDLRFPVWSRNRGHRESVLCHRRQPGRHRSRCRVYRRFDGDRLPRPHGRQRRKRRVDDGRDARSGVAAGLPGGVPGLAGCR